MTVSTTNAPESPTNPKFATTGATDNNRFFITISTNNASVNVAFNISGSTMPERNNLETTKGFRIKCYDSRTQEGVLFNESDFATRNYFVLIHSDDDKKHHFARITEILTDDEYGDSFEFEPKLGNEISKDTKFILYKGDLKTNTDTVAVSYGLKQNSSSMDLENNIVVARPHFYFFNEYLDKENELDHNQKYEFTFAERVGESTTVPSPNVDDVLIFRTKEDFGNIIIDYSKFSHRVTLTDKLRTIDDTTTGTITTNEGLSVATNQDSYNFIYPHSHRLLPKQQDTCTMIIHQPVQIFSTMLFQMKLLNLLLERVDFHLLLLLIMEELCKRKLKNFSRIELDIIYIVVN